MRHLTTLIIGFTLCVGSVAAIAPLVKSQELVQKEIKNERILTVSGRGERSVKTTKARIELGVNVEAKTAIAVQTEVARQSNSLVTKLQQLGVEQLQTTSIQLNPKYVYENNRQRQEGFTGQTSVSFVIAIEKAGATLDAAVASGANQVQQISFIATDKELNDAKQIALQDAVKDAQTQANSVLSVLGFTPKLIKTIVIGDSPIALPLPQQRLDVLKSVAAAPPTPVLGGEQKVEAVVTLQIVY